MKGTAFYVRQRLLLALIAKHQGGLTHTDVQKKLFLLTEEFPVKDKKPYEFFPYQYGCYSLHCARDLDVLQNQEMLYKKGEKFYADINGNIGDMPNEWRATLLRFVSTVVGKLSGDDLVKHVYKTHPYYAINRENLSEVLEDKKWRDKVSLARPSKKGQTLFTIGYEGGSFESYVNRLIENDVKLLIDVRANPLSRKLGLSKGNLAEVLPNVKIDYMHFPELGISGELRRDLPDAESRRKLFDDYRQGLSRVEESLNKIQCLLKKYKRVALTCFELAAEDCHRHCISGEIERVAKVKVEHI